MPHLGNTALVAIGDSLTFNNVYAPTLSEFYPHRVANMINANPLNPTFTPYNYGVASEGSSQILSRAAAIAANGVGEIIIVWAGTNDPLPDNNLPGALAVGPNIASTVELMGRPNRTLVIGNHYNNISVGLADTINGQHPRWGSLRTRQKEGAKRAGVAYLDLYTYMRSYLVDNPGQIANDNLWNVGVGNAHINAAGQLIIAEAIYSKIVSLGWVAKP